MQGAWVQSLVREVLHAVWWGQYMCVCVCVCVCVFPGGSVVKNLPAKHETQAQSLGWKDHLEEEMATRTSILAWKILWTEELGRLQTMGSQRIGHHWASKQTTMKNTGLVSPSLLQGIFPIQESNQGILHHRRILYQLSYQRSSEFYWAFPFKLQVYICGTMPIEVPPSLSLSFERLKYGCYSLWPVHFTRSPLPSHFPPSSLTVFHHLLKFAQWKKWCLSVGPRLKGWTLQFDRSHGLKPVSVKMSGQKISSFFWKKKKKVSGFFLLWGRNNGGAA